MVSFILIYERDSLEVKIKIYHQAIGMITTSIFKSLLLCIVIEPRTALKKVVVEGLLMMYLDKCVQ